MTTEFSIGVIRACALVGMFIGAASSCTAAKVAPPLSGPAYKLADEAYKAFARGDYAVAVDRSRAAVRLRPDVLRLRVLRDRSVDALKCSVGEHAACTPDPPGYAQATAAYKAFEDVRFVDAVKFAKSAVAEAPNNSSYRLLLINSLIANGSLDEARDQVDLAKILFPGDKSISDQRQLVLDQQALLVAGQAYGSLSDAAQGSLLSKQALEMSPGTSAYRTLWAYSLFLENRLSESDAALRSSKGVSDLLVRAMARQSMGRNEEALADILQSILLSQGQSDELNVRLTGADVLMAGGQYRAAQSILRGVAAQSVAVAWRYRVSVVRTEAPDLDEQRPAYPKLDCTFSLPEPSCSVLFEQSAMDPSFSWAERAYEAFGKSEYVQAAASAERAVAYAPDQRTYRLLLIQAYLAAGKDLLAEQAITEALDVSPGDAELWALRGTLRLKRRAKDLAREDLVRSLRLDGLSPHEKIRVLVRLEQYSEARQKFMEFLNAGELSALNDVDVAYLAIQVGNDEAALQIFDRLDQSETLPDSALLDVAYLAVRSHADAVAIQKFKRTVDAAEAQRIRLDLQSIFEARRSISAIERKWGVLSSISYRGLASNFTVSPLAPPQNRATSLQLGAEVFWRPNGFQNAQYTELFVRFFQTLYGRDGALAGTQTALSSVGARWKPFTSENLVLSVERLIAVGSLSSSDWLARVGYSRSVGGDLRLDVPTWWMAHFYGEAGEYLGAHRRYAVWDGQLGRSYRLPGSWSSTVMTPHWMIGGEWNASSVNATALGMGPGVNVRYWFREDYYHAPQSYIDVSLQYRFRLQGDRDRQGLYFQATTVY